MLPLQNIPDGKKDKSWAEACVRSIMLMVGNSFVSKEKDRFCYNLHNGIFNEADYDYLRKVDSYEFPAKIRFIPLLRPKCDLLKSQETKRPFNIKAFTIDTESLKSKQDQVARAVIDKIEGRLMDKITGLQEAQMEIDRIQQSIDEQIAQVQQSAEQQGVNPNVLMANKAMVDQLEKAKREFEKVKKPLKKEEIFSQKDMEEIELFHKFKYRDYLELLADKTIKYAMFKYNLKEVFNDGFEDRIVVDKEYYFVDFIPGQADPSLRRVNPLRFWHSLDEEARWVGDCQWAMEERYMSLNQIIDEFKGKISVDQIDRLKKMRGYGLDDYSVNNYSPYQYGNQMDYITDDCSAGVYTGSVDTAANYRVCYCYWLSPRQIRFKKSKSKNNDAEFTKWLNDEDKAKPEELEVGYVNDVWRGICIGGTEFICLEKNPVQLRSEDNYGKVQLPYVGMNRRPYSIVWAAKDIQLLYNLMHYHKELMIALAGVRGFIMDKSQIPDGMSPQEWLYQRKLGIGWIQTVKEGRQQTQFNQFKDFDDSLSPSIQFVIQICDHLKSMVDDITGVSRQRMGAVASDDLVGNTEASIQQSSLITEIIFWRHDHVKRKAMERWINLCKIAWKNGKRAAFIGDDFMQEIMNIPADTFNKADYELFVSDAGKEERAINDLKGMIAQEYGKGTISLPQMIKIHSMDSLKMMEAAAEKYFELAEQKAVGAAQNQQDFEFKKQQLDQDFQMKLKDYDAQLKSIDSEINRAKVEVDKQKMLLENDFKNKELQVKSGVDMTKAGNERQVELAYLDEQKREADMDYEINRMELANKISTATAKDVGNKKNIEKVKN